MGIYNNNIIKTRKDSDGFNKLRCKCGSTRMEVKVILGSKECTDVNSDEYYENDQSKDWILVYCKKCDQSLFYNGC